MIEEFIVRKKRAKGKRATNLDSIEVESVCHVCTEEELTKQFPTGYLPLRHLTSIQTQSLH